MGRVLPARNASAWIEGLTEMMAKLPTNDERLTVARQAGGDRKWDIAFAKLWADGL
jgi:hypothetical protein